jgi:hypothetical protein
MLTLYFLFFAAEHMIHPGVLVAGYGLAFLPGKVAFVSPGRVGIIESGMAAVYSSLGVPKYISVVVILRYHLFSILFTWCNGFCCGRLPGEQGTLDQECGLMGTLYTLHFVCNIVESIR